MATMGGKNVKSSMGKHIANAILTYRASAKA